MFYYEHYFLVFGSRWSYLVFGRFQVKVEIVKL